MRRALAVMLSLLVFLPVSGCTLSVYNLSLIHISEPTRP